MPGRGASGRFHQRDEPHVSPAKPQIMKRQMALLEERLNDLSNRAMPGVTMFRGETRPGAAFA